MANENRKIINPLLNVSVTGGTIEEFTQNALLLPAAEHPVATTTVAQEITQSVPEQQLTEINQFDEQQLKQSQSQPSLFSTFSSYLTRNSNSFDNLQPSIDVHPQQQLFEPQPPPPVSVEPVPLFTPGEVVNVANPIPPQIPKASGSTANNYRRGTLKRPTYAPIPGLSNNLANVQLNDNSAHNLPPVSIPTTIPSSTNSYFQPELSGYGIEPTLILHQESTSTPFLNPITTTELFQPQVSGNEPSSILTPTDFYSFPNNQINMNANDTNPTMPDESFPTTSADSQNHIYRPVYHHWFYKREVEGKVIWNPMSMMDSLNIETAFLSHDLSPEKIVATDGGRYDVNVLKRERYSVYWNSQPTEVRRCSWFHKGNTDGKYIPYDENIATKLEEEFKIAFETNGWNRKVELSNGENVVFHGPDVLVLFPQVQAPDAWGNTPNQPRPRVVKRGMDEFHIEEGEPTKVDHLLFIVHGIGSVCDLKFRTVEEVVDEFRSISLQLVQSHYRSSCENGVVNRVEVLPISWHEKLHRDTGVDEKLKAITLESIPRLRDFSNDTILDVLFYTSPVYCQTIISSVGNELNRIYELFKSRNPSFEGGVSLGGHSLGSLILFDLLCHQKEDVKREEPQTDDEGEDVVSPLKPHPKDRQMSRRISYMMGEIGTGQPQLNYPNLSFHPRHFFALGSPIGMFVTVRGLDILGEQFALPTCAEFYNIFHPYDPVAYRIEPLVNTELAKHKPVLIPHHKGRKRMHLELKETMARVGADLKQKILDSMKSTWNSFYPFSIFKPPQQSNTLEAEVDKVFEEQLNKSQNDSDQNDESNSENGHTDLSVGILNNGKRVDYVLQEAPLEFINEYIFALTSHVCYWDSEDTMLFILKEIYNSINVSADNKIPQQTMTIERPVDVNSSPSPMMGVDPTVPMMVRADIGPPPVAGFVRKA